VVEGAGGVAILRQALLAGAPLMLSVLLAAALAGAAGNLVQHGLLYAPDKLKPDFSRVSPMAGLKRMFGPDGLMQFAKSVSKLILVAVIAWWALKPHAKEFAQLGYIEGKNIEFERRAAQGKSDRLPGIIDDLVAKHVDVIVTASYPAAAAAKERAGTTPVVVTFSGDPVATGLAASLAHPGGNITGVSEIAAELSAKRLAVLKEAVPSVHAVAVLWNADDLGMTLRYQAAEVEAERVGMLIVPLGVRAPTISIRRFPK